MKRILIMNNAAIGGGVETVMNDLVHFLVEKKEQVTVYTTFNEYDFYEKYPKEVKYIHLSVPNRSRFPKQYSKYKGIKYINRIENWLAMSYLKTKKFDVIIAIKEGTTMQLASRLNAQKKVAWVHVDYRYLYWTKSVFGTGQAECECMKKNFDHIVCVSQSAAESVRNTIGDPQNLCVRYNPIDYRNIRKKALAETNIKKQNGKMLFVASGRFTAQKNFGLLVETCLKLVNHYEFELWIIGNGPERDELDKLIKDSKAENIKILGFLDNPFPIMKQADWFISTAVWESYGLAIQESLVLGVPVLTTACPAIEEVFDERFGKIVSNDEDALKDAMIEILENPQVTSDYRGVIEQQYNVEALWENRLKDICSLWESEG